MKNHHAPRKKTVLLLGVIAAFIGIGLWQQGTERGFAAERPAANESDDIVDVLPRDQIPAVFAPRFVPASRAGIKPEAHVIGYAARGGEAHAYALNLLNGHEIVNDVVGGQKIAATW